MSIQIGKKVTYRMIESESYVEDAGWITSYGICCEEKNPDNETVLTPALYLIFYSFRLCRRFSGEADSL